ncbi:MAG: S1 RNA-binding domain-containing protein [Chitinispirillales bacterium]|jgi:small subunit ribosomal protein S1|nr:S1 RNA-binding domain-containing protein [Chitinispirillales bacterium]
MSVGKAVSQNEELTSAQQEQMAQINKLDSIEPKEDVVGDMGDTKKSKSAKATKAQLRELSESKSVIEGRVTGVNRGGYNVKILGHNAFCPFSQIAAKKPEDLNSFLNNTYEFVIVKIESKGTNIILSRLPLVKGDIDERIKQIEEIAKNNETISGAISGILMDKTKKDETGAFVDLDGVEGLVHISELSWTRAAKVSDVVKEGETHVFRVLSVERKDPLAYTKVKLSLKRVTEDPWNNIEDVVKVGSTVDAVVARIAQNGAFVTLENGVEALIKTEDLSWEKFKKISSIVKKGQKISVKVINVNIEKRQIDCSLKDEKNNPWSDIASKYTAGSKVKGIVADEKEYGYFIDFEFGITGLLNKARIASEKGKKDGIWKKGEEVEVTIQFVDVEERKIVLSYGEAEFVPAQIFEQTKKKKEKSSKSSKLPAVSYDTARQSIDETSEFANLLKNALTLKNKLKK